VFLKLTGEKEVILCIQWLLLGQSETWFHLE